MKIFDNKIWHDSEKIGWIENSHIRAQADGRKLGWFDHEFIYNEDGRKVAYLKENELMFENGQAPVSLEHINEKIEGTASLIEKCAVYVLLEE